MNVFGSAVRRGSLLVALDVMQGAAGLPGTAPTSWGALLQPSRLVEMLGLHWPNDTEEATVQVRTGRNALWVCGNTYGLSLSAQQPACGPAAYHVSC